MKKIISTVSAAAVLALSLLAGITPVSAATWHQDYQQQDRYIGDYCDRNPYATQCNDWRANRSTWGNSQYRASIVLIGTTVASAAILQPACSASRSVLRLTGSPGYDGRPCPRLRKQVSLVQRAHRHLPRLRRLASSLSSLGCAASSGRTQSEPAPLFAPAFHWDWQRRCGRSLRP